MKTEWVTFPTTIKLGIWIRFKFNFILKKNIRIKNSNFCFANNNNTGTNYFKTSKIEVGSQYASISTAFWTVGILKC